MPNLKSCFNYQDFRNYQYTLPVVQGLVVDMEVRKTSIKIPSNRYNEVMLIIHTFVYSVCDWSTWDLEELLFYSLPLRKKCLKSQ